MVVVVVVEDMIVSVIIFGFVFDFNELRSGVGSMSIGDVFVFENYVIFFSEDVWIEFFDDCRENVEWYMNVFGIRLFG